MPASFADLSQFVSLEKARAIIVSDVKLDDVICLWVILMHNFTRPAHHRVEIDVYVTGVRDGPAATTLAQHIYDSAREAAEGSGRRLCTVEFRALASRRPAATAPRHEADTYQPYRDWTSGWPAADERMPIFWEDLSPEEERADFVAVIGQFFNFEVVDAKGKIRDDILDFLVPKPGGILVFQSGFNTQVAKPLEANLWQALYSKVERARAKMVFISNRFSFDTTSGRPGNSPPDATYLQNLLECDSKLWSHLIDAGLKESSRFAVDQMAKWLTGTNLPGVDLSKVNISEIKAKYEITDGSPHEVSQALLRAFLEARAAGKEPNPVLAACSELHANASAACGSSAADYLGRAVANLEKYGQTLECTDGQHFAIILQNEASVLEPFTMDFSNPMQPQFDGAAPGVTWAAKDVRVPDALAWLEKATTLALS